MVAITRALAPTRAVTGAPTRSPPNLDAQMRTCRAQLADWVTCPSAKTPEGKAKIEQITARLDSIKDEIKKSDGTSSSAMTSQPGRPSSPAPEIDDAGGYLETPSRIGGNVDTYA